MTIAIVDVETYKKEGDKYKPVLDTHEFILGHYREEGGKQQFFSNKEDMWAYIINRGKQLYTQRKKLSVYGHNHWYDFLAYADYTSENITYFCESPFIAGYEENGKEIIKFLDTFSLYKTSLKSMGELVGLPKLDLLGEIDDPFQLRTYLARDTEIPLKFKHIYKL